MEVPGGEVVVVVTSTAEVRLVVRLVPLSRSALCTLGWHRQTRKGLVSDSEHESLHYPSLPPLATAGRRLLVGSGSCCIQGVPADHRRAES